MTETAPGDHRSIRGLNALLPLLFAALGPLVYAAPLGAVPGLLVLALGAAVTAWQARALGWRGILCDIGVFAPLFAWMLLSSLWSLDLHAALSLALRLVVVFVAGIAVVHWARTLTLERLGICLPALALGFTIAGAIVLLDLLLAHGMIALQLHTQHYPNYTAALYYGRGATIHAILIVPLLLGLWRGGWRRLAILQLVIGALAILATLSLSAKMALAAALAVGAGVLLVPRLRFVLLGAVALGVVALPFALPWQPDADTVCWLSNHKASALHRLYIWNFAAGKIAERRAAGWGLDAARRIPGGDFPVVIRGCDAEHRPTKQLWVDGTLMPLHPHNAILQVWLELGGIGALLGFGAVLLVLFRGFRAAAWRSRRAQAGLAAACFGGLSVALVSFGVWQEWFLSALFMAAAVAVLAARQDALPPVSA